MKPMRLALVALAALTVTAIAAGGAGAGRGDDQLSKVNHIVVIYEENHSFDNLYGGWEGVNGPQNADAAHTLQVNQAGVPFQCLLQYDVNLQAQSAANPSAPLTATCNDTTTATPFPSHFANAPFNIGDYIAATDTTCPLTPLTAFSSANGFKKGTGSPGGCTRDIVHRFYQEIFQLNGGQQNRYMLGSDAAGTVMGAYDTKALPVYEYLHGDGHPHYAIADDFFQAAFGGSFLQHQWLIAAASPTCNAANGCPANALHSVLDANGFPQRSYPPTASRPPGTGALYTSPAPASLTLVDSVLTQSCGLPTTVAGLACGDYGVNTMQPAFQPSGLFGAKLPAQTNPTIGDRLSAAGVDWAWYSGGWSNANGDVGAPGWTNGTVAAPTLTGCPSPFVDPGVSHWPRCPDNLFQYHHQPFNYYAPFTTATPAGLTNRAAHLRDEEDFIQSAQSSTKSCNLKGVSFIKPVGEENEHPGYASEPDGSDHLVSLLQSIENSACAKDTMVIVTYDEFGGQWDHVPPPGQGGAPGVHDQWGPGSRIPALIVSPGLRGNEVVDHTQYDTTSILATIEQRWDLNPLTTRDASVNSLADVFQAKQYEAGGK
jgi:acid phosphatase